MFIIGILVLMFSWYIDEEIGYMLSELKNVILLILTVIDLVFIFLSIFYSFEHSIENVFAEYDFLVCLLLFIDLSYDYFNYEGSLKNFLFKEKNILAIISILPFDIIFRYLSVFRLFRFVKVLKIIRIYNVKRDLGSLSFFIQNHLFKLLFVILTVYAAVSSVLLIILDDSIDTLGDAVWFMVVTASGVGYGDITPVSPIGKALTILTIIIGIIFVAILTAYLSAIYNEKQEMETRDTVFKYVKKIEKTNKVYKNEMIHLNTKLEQLEQENKLLNEKLSNIDEKLDEISKKLD